MTQPNFGEPVSLEVAVKSEEVKSSASALDKPKEGKPLAVMQEETRANLAKYLVGGWAITTLLVLLLVAGEKFAYYRLPDNERANIRDQTGAKDLITLVLTTQSTLVGAAIGFYFGTRETK
jgi:hypothetical protein